MTNIETSTHYNGDIVIDFYPDSHRYKLRGDKKYLVGVTTATGVVDKSRPLMIWASRLTKEFLEKNISSGKIINQEDIAEAVNQWNVKRDEAASSGTLVHLWAEKFINSEKPEVPQDEKVKNGVLAFLRWVKENEVRFIASEKKIYSKKYKYVGTLDCMFTMGKEGHKIKHLGDFKTSSGVYIEMAFQTAAYQEAETEEFGTTFGERYILRFDKETAQFETKCFAVEEQREHFAGFLSCLNIKEISKIWETRHGFYAK